MEVTPKSKKAMSKDEVAYFVELLQDNKLLLSKQTNATNNKLKGEAWGSVTAAFNAHFGNVPKNKEQLKLKWDNLKKAARKRSQQIRMNNLKTGGGKADFIPPDDILDKVTGLLGSTCSGFEVPFGGDGVGDCVLICNEDASEGLNINNTMETFNEEFLPSSSGAQKRKLDLDTENSKRKFLNGMPFMSKSLQNKGRKKKGEDGRLEKNQAIARYFNKKAEKLELEMELLKIEIENRRNNVI